MSEAENKQLLADYLTEVWQKANVEAVRDFLHPAFQRHVSPQLPPLDLEGQVQRLRGFREAFPDITLTIEDVIADGDRIAFRSTMRGTQRGEFAGSPPTGKEVTVTLVDVIRIEDGKFAEQWGGPDVYDLVRQLQDPMPD